MTRSEESKCSSIRAAQANRGNNSDFGVAIAEWDAQEWRPVGHRVQSSRFAQPGQFQQQFGYNPGLNHQQDINSIEAPRLQHVKRLQPPPSNEIITISDSEEEVTSTQGSDELVHVSHKETELGYPSPTPCATLAHRQNIIKESQKKANPYISTACLQRKKESFQNSVAESNAVSRCSKTAETQIADEYSANSPNIPLSQFSTPSNSRKLPKVPPSTMPSLIKQIQRLEAALKQHANTGLIAEAVRDGSFAELGKECALLAAMLGYLPEKPQVPDTLEEYEKPFLIHHVNGYTYLAQTLHVFKGVRKQGPPKVFGYIRHKGELEPLKGKFSGSKYTADTHPLLLDSEYWLPAVQEFARRHNHKFPRSPYEETTRRSDPEGTDYASHAEPQLMLWYASEMIKKLCGINRNAWERLGDVHLLKEHHKGLEADIVLSHCRGTVCSSCKAFGKFMFLVTGIKFNFVIFENVGPLEVGKDKYKRNTISTYSFIREPRDDRESVDEMDEAFTPPPSMTSARRTHKSNQREARKFMPQGAASLSRDSAEDFVIFEDSPAATQSVVIRNPVSMQVIIPSSNMQLEQHLATSQQVDFTGIVARSHKNDKQHRAKTHQRPTVEDDIEEDRLQNHPFSILARNANAARKQRTEDLLMQKGRKRDREDLDFSPLPIRHKKKKAKHI